MGTGFHPELTGRENIYLNGAILGMSRKEIARKFDEIVAFAEMEKFLDTPVKRYSSGMYVRLAFAVAAHLEPEILVIDEVLAVGDAAFQKKCLGKMGDVARSGRTVLFVSHNMQAVARLCRSCVLLADGRIQGSGSTDDVVKEYLALHSPTSHHYQNESPPKDADVSITSVFLSNASDGSHVDFFKPFACSVAYRVTKRVASLHINIKITNGQNITTVFTSSLDYAVRRGAEYTDPGTYIAQVTIPGHYLFPGRYSVDAEAETHKVQVYDVARRCLSFEVVNLGDADLDGDGWGVTYPDLEWDVRRLDSENE